MDARKAIQRSVAIAAIAVGFGVFAASPVYRYGGDFNLQIPAQRTATKTGWLNQLKKSLAILISLILM